MPNSSLSFDLIKAWLTGRARIRNYHLTHHGDIHAALRPEDTAVNGEEVWEYIVANTSDDVLQAVAKEIRDNPARLLIVAEDLSKKAEPASAPAKRLEEKTGLRAMGVGEQMMVTDMMNQDVETPPMPEEYVAEVQRHDGWNLVAFKTTAAHPAGEGILAARGRVAMVDEHAVFDQIWTNHEFRRQGLGSLMMRYLSSLALEEATEHGLLIAGADGQGLYSYLGWSSIANIVLLGHPDVEPKDSLVNTYQN